MVDGDRINSWRTVSIVAGHYQINVGSTFEEDSFEMLKQEAFDLLEKSKNMIPMVSKSEGSEFG